jgi:hypothetical protein
MYERMMSFVQTLRIVFYAIMIICVFFVVIKGYVWADVPQEECFWPPDMVPHPHPPEPKPKDDDNNASI